MFLAKRWVELGPA
jgi:hypothetical protein